MLTGERRWAAEGSARGVRLLRGRRPPLRQFRMLRMRGYGCLAAGHAERHRRGRVLHHGAPSAAAGWQHCAEELAVGQPVGLASGVGCAYRDAQTARLPYSTSQIRMPECKNEKLVTRLRCTALLASALKLYALQSSAALLAHL